MVDQAVEVSEDLADDGSRYGELPSLKERCESEISSLGHLGSVTNALHGDLHYNLSKSLLKKNVNGPLGRRKAGVGRVGSGRRVVERMQRGRREELEELRSKGMVKLRLAEPGARDRALRMFSKLRKHGRRPSSKGLKCGSLGRKRGGVGGGRRGGEEEAEQGDGDGVPGQRADGADGSAAEPRAGGEAVQRALQGAARAAEAQLPAAATHRSR